ncbi:MAG: hypothetical protein HKN76_08320, partial [Saprospiraceae bacterium]|nr:hypothetical protein [Saprospiraceae bacterium]
MAHLFSEFKGVTKEEWLAQVKKDLKGQSWRNLDWMPQPSLRVSPFADTSDIESDLPAITRGRLQNSWEIGVPIFVGQDYQVANQYALEALQGGAESLLFFLENADVEDLKQLLTGIKLELITTHFHLQTRDRGQFLENLRTIIDQTKINTEKICCSIRGDVSQGNTELPGKGFPKIEQVISTTLDSDTETIEQLEDLINNARRFISSAPSEKTCSNLTLSVPIGKYYFLNIAKLRALQVLWQQVNLNSQNKVYTVLKVEAFFPRNVFIESADQNLIITAPLAMSAIIGGAQRLFIRPPDSASENVSFARGIAQNVQHIMKMECGLNRVIDPAAGSYYIESLTGQLVQAVARKVFKSPVDFKHLREQLTFDEQPMEWNTPEDIEVKSVFSMKDLQHGNHLHFAAGIPPYLRGPYSS